MPTDPEARSELTIRALSRGLRLLAVLNSRGEASLADLAKETGLPRPTAYRLLQSLLAENYITKDELLSTYHPAPRCCSLSSGFMEDAWLLEHTQEDLNKLGDELIWPISIATNAGTRMIVRKNTDIESPLAVRKFMPGTSLGLLESASGKLFLAKCTVARRAKLLKIISASSDPLLKTDSDRARLEKLLDKIRAVGYATHTKPGKYSEARAIAVPITVEKKVIATLTIRYAKTAVSNKRAEKEFLPLMFETARKIGIKISADQRALPAFGLGD